MPCCVLLECTKEILVVKDSWCEKVNGADIRNGGCGPSDSMKIFYSPNKKRRADFSLETSPNFDADATTCYDGFVIYICGKYIETMKIRRISVLTLKFMYL